MTKRNKPKGEKGMRRVLVRETRQAAIISQKAMHAAGGVIDKLEEERKGMIRVLIQERAQVIYYSDLAIGYCRRTIVDPVITGFLQLDDAKKEPYIKQAVLELSEGHEGQLTPHESPLRPQVVLTDGSD